MMLFWLIAVPLLGGAACWGSERVLGRGAATLALVVLALETLLFASLPPHAGDGGGWLMQLAWPWIPRFGIGFHLALDGISYLLVALTLLLGFMAVGCSWPEIDRHRGLYYLNVLWTLAGTIGVFLAIDLFLFFFFWEVMLVPMYFLISIWGHENRAYAAMKFFIFTQVSGLLMLIAILALVFCLEHSSGMLSFDYLDLLGQRLDAGTARWIMLGFFVAFTVKLPAVPFHTWLPDAHTQAPTGGSVLLAGVLLKTGAYGLLRFAIPLFPEAAREFAPAAMGLGVVGILYGAKLAFAQTDLKRLIAYTSVSHMGFVLVGAYAFNAYGFQGAVMTMLAHGISAAALFMLAGALQCRLHTRDMGRMGGFWTAAPRFGGVALFFSLAALGLPGLGNFIGEFLVLLGGFRSNIALTAAAALGLVLAPVYSLHVVQRVFHGAAAASLPADLRASELALLAVLMTAAVALGIRPQPFLDLSKPALAGASLIPESRRAAAGAKPEQVGAVGAEGTQGFGGGGRGAVR
jgi:NADH-quinone oxidoreductase subunit M